VRHFPALERLQFGSVSISFLIVELFQMLVASESFGTSQVLANAVLTTVMA
jgi:hypothetical protein